MATMTLQYASFDNGAVVVEYDVLTSNWRASQVRCINNSPHDARLRVYEAGELIFEQTGPANDEVSWNVTGIQLAWQPDYWNDVTEEWEAGGIELYDYVLEAQWPAEGS